MTADHDDAHADHEGIHDEHDADRPDYDPENVELPSREPPLRSTAPQSDFTRGQVARGFLILAVGLALTVGVALALA